MFVHVCLKNVKFKEICRYEVKCKNDVYSIHKTNICSNRVLLPILFPEGVETESLSSRKVFNKAELTEIALAYGDFVQNVSKKLFDEPLRIRQTMGFKKEYFTCNSKAIESHNFEQLSKDEEKGQRRVRICYVERIYLNLYL